MRKRSVFILSLITWSLNAGIPLLDWFAAAPFPPFSKAVINEDILNQAQHNFAIRETIINNHKKDIQDYNQQLAHLVAQLAVLEEKRKELAQIAQHMAQVCTQEHQAPCQELYKTAAVVWKEKLFKSVRDSDDQMQKLLNQIKKTSEIIQSLESDQQMLQASIDEYIRFTRTTA